MRRCGWFGICRLQAGEIVRREYVQERIVARAHHSNFVLRGSCGWVEMITGCIGPAIQRHVTKPDVIHRWSAARSQHSQARTEQHTVEQPVIVVGLKSGTACLDTKARPDGSVPPGRQCAGGARTERERILAARETQRVGVDHARPLLEPGERGGRIIGGWRRCVRDHCTVLTRARRLGRLRAGDEQHDAQRCNAATRSHTVTGRQIRQHRSPCDAPAPRENYGCRARGTRGR